jgi:gamma-glutamyl-gamma-aminobutyrate hydrolase PuuD
MTRPVIGVTASIDRRSPVFGETYALTRKYAEGVLQAGGVPVIVPHNLDEDAAKSLWRLDGLLLSAAAISVGDV